MANISVIIPTLNRYPYICDTVQQVCSLMIPGDECIVIDQSDPDLRIKIFDEIGGLSFVKLVPLETKSLPNARNFGIKSSSRDIVLFLDDDVVISPSLLDAHRMAHADQTVGCVSGKVIEEPDHFTNSPVPGSYVSFWGRSYRNFNCDDKCFIKAAAGGNMSFKRKVLQITGDFDVHFSGNATLEETDYSYRIRKNGFKILFEPHAELLHLAAPAGGCRVPDPIDKEFHNLKNSTLFYLKNMPKSFFPLFAVTNAVVFTKRLNIYTSFSGSLKTVFNGIRAGIQAYMETK